MSANPLAACKFGYVEQDGAQYCYEHTSFRECWAKTSFCSRVEKELIARRRARAQTAIESETNE